MTALAAPPVSVRAHVLSAPIDRPVRASFGAMTARPGLFVEIADGEGQSGWGEVWCNFPPGGAAHRARLVGMIGDMLLESCRAGTTPAELSGLLTARTRTLAIQCGEAGPFAQVIAGVDGALWDLAARQHQVPLWQALAPEQAKPDNAARVLCYASGINPDSVLEQIEFALGRHFVAFKVKVGFGRDQDLRNLRTARDRIGELALMADANQGWDFDTACGMLPELAEFGLAFLEEPLAADEHRGAWRKVGGLADMTLAAGENCLRAGLEAHIADRTVGVLQPDLCKWGGPSAVLAMARQSEAAGITYFPHFLGGAVGQLASAHVLYAVGGSGRLEVDVNPNPLRSAIGAPSWPQADGLFHLPDGPGLGFTPDLDALALYAKGH